MSNITQLIQDFKSEDTRALPNPDTSKKPRLIRQLEELDDPDAIGFLVQVAGDQAEFDLARIEAFRVLELKRPAEQALRQQIAGVIARVVSSDPDDDVRNYAAMAAAYYMAYDGVADAVVRVLLDATEGSDLRWNAFTAVEKMGGSPKAVEALNTVRRDAEFRRSAERVLGGWNAA